MDAWRKIKQAQRVGYVAARFPYGFPKLFLCEAEFIDQPPKSLGLLDRVQIDALQVLHQCSGHCVPIAEFADQDRHFVSTRLLGRPASVVPRQ